MLGLLLLLAQEARVPVAPPAPAVAQEPVRVENVWVSPDEVEITHLLDVCAGLIGVPIEFSRTELSGTVTLRQPGFTSAEAVLEATNRALFQRGFTTVQMPGGPGLTVVKVADAAAMARLEESGISTKAGFVKLLVRLDHDRVDSIGEAVKLVLSKAGAVTVFKDARSLIVSDTAANVRQAQTVIARLDANLDELALVEVPLQHTSPTALTTLLDRIGNAKKLVFGDKGRGTLLAHPEGKSVLIVAPVLELDVWRGLIDQFDRAEPVLTRHYSPQRFSLADTAKLIEQVVRGDPKGEDTDPWRMVVDGLTGSLLITTTPSKHSQVEDVLERLEKMAQVSRRPIKSFPIKNRPVDELQALLQGLLDAGALKGVVPSTQPAAASAAPSQGVTAPLPTPPPAVTKSDEFGDKVILTTDKATNRLIAIGESRVLEQLEGLINQLDIRQPQVLVEAMVVTLTDTQSRELGGELQKVGSEGDLLYKVSSLFGFGSPDPNVGSAPQVGGTGFGGVVLDPGNFSALVHALERVNEGRTLTMPRVLVNNNQPATLDSVLQTPYASTNASTTVATTSFGGTLSAGTQIAVTPQIAAGDQLIVDYSISLSSFTGAAADPALPPPRQENKLKSIATVPDGYTVIVGGLEITTDSRGRAQVPILGSIPILGALFGSRSANEDKTRFYVFLRCNVMRSANFEDLKFASKNALDAAQVDDGWPKLEPRIMR